MAEIIKIEIKLKLKFNWKCGLVQIFRNDGNNSKFDSGENQEETEIW
jgi:hypothetical protein